ncbi:MAG: glycosyltransferase family 4 protein [Acetobacteraceae bacterium]|nr:glycosyltransferase family 4 protein [Acetobacteraceae bacterium]
MAGAADPARGRVLRRPARRVVCILCPGGLEHAGGIGRAMGNLVAALAAADPTLPIEVLDTRGPGHIALSPLYLARALARIAVLRFSGRLALLHVNVSTHGSAARKLVVSLFAAALGARLVLHLHAAVFEEFYRDLPGSLRAVLRWMFRRADRVVVLGAHWKRVVGDLGVAPERIAIICNGVRAPAAGRQAGDRGDAPLHLVFTSRLCALKGTDDLLLALASPALHGQPWRATLAGDGDRETYREQAARLGIAGRVAFPGWLGREDVERLLGEADVLVLPSHAEGLSVAVLEALASQVPVITTPVGSIPEFLADGESVLFIPPGDVEALAGALHRLIASPALRARLAAGGGEAFRRHFDSRAVAEQTLALYREIDAGMPRSYGLRNDSGLGAEAG